MPQTLAHGLKERHRQCLRLVLLHYDSKQIARELHLSHHTVDKLVQEAMRVLGASDRFSAARILAEQEHGPDYQRLVYQMLGMESAPFPPAKRPLTTVPEIETGSGEDRDDPSGAAKLQAREPAAFMGIVDDRPQAGSKRNDLSRSDRMKLIGLYALGILIALVLASALADSVLRVFQRAVQIFQAN